MGQWSTFAELETCLFASTVLYLNLLALSAYAGLARRHGDTASGKDGGKVSGRRAPVGRRMSGSAVVVLVLAIGLAAALSLLAWLAWPWA